MKKTKTHKLIHSHRLHIDAPSVEKPKFVVMSTDEIMAFYANAQHMLGRLLVDLKVIGDGYRPSDQKPPPPPYISTIQVSGDVVVSLKRGDTLPLNQIIGLTSHKPKYRQAFHETLSNVKSLLESNEKAYGKVLGNKNINNMCIVSLQLHELTVHVQYLYWTDKRPCSRCDKLIYPVNRVKHQKTLACKLVFDRRKLEKRGWGFTSNPLVVAAVRSGEIEGRLIPMKWKYYVPKWIDEAASVYHKSHRFAGMSFPEFVLRMAPEKGIE